MIAFQLDLDLHRTENSAIYPAIILVENPALSAAYPAEVWEPLTILVCQ
jgi:hypothetical protein